MEPTSKPRIRRCTERLPANSDMTSLVKVSNKHKPSFDHNLDLKSLWAADSTRNWLVYSRDTFRKFWDITEVEHRSK